MRKHTRYGKMIEDAMVQKGWNQTDLARRASERLPDGKKLDRQRISTYINDGRQPGSLFSRAIADALGLDLKACSDAMGHDFDDDLYSDDSVKPADAKSQQAFSIKLEGANAHVQLDMRLPIAVAMEIAKLIAGSERNS